MVRHRHPFKRGSSFHLTLVVPDSFPDGHFTAYRLHSQLRRYRHTQPSGLIATLACNWVDPIRTRELVITHEATADWPLGPAELDVRLTAPTGTQLHSTTTHFEIVRSMSHG